MVKYFLKTHINKVYLKDPKLKSSMITKILLQTSLLEKAVINFSN